MSDTDTQFKGRREDLRLITGQGRFTNDWNLEGQAHAAFRRDGAFPAAFGFFRDHVETPGDLVCSLLRAIRIGHDIRVERAGDRRLFDD